MKKILYFASALLAVFMTYACSSIEDNAAPTNIPVTITDADGNKYETYQVATFKGEVGSEVSLKVGVYDDFDIYGVDFGDGKIVVDTVCYQNKGLLGEDGLSKPGTSHGGITEFKGTVAGNGTIIVYGKSDIWYLYLSGGVAPTSFDQEKLKKVVQFSISKVAIDAIDLTGFDEIEQFSFTQGSLKSIDVSNNAKLKNLTINNNTASTFESVLESLDLTKNTNLEQLNVMGASADKPGKLTKLDLSKNTKLTNLYAQYNALTEVILPEGATLSFLNLMGNQLESVDLTKLTSFKDIYLSANKLKTLDLSKAVKGTIQIQNNLFTLATLPTKPAVTTTSKYTYAPQPAYEVAEAITDANNLLDLSSQLTATGVATEPQTTTYTFFAGTTELKENEDYKVVEPGKFTFLKSQTEKVHAVMATDAFPKFTGSNAYKTTEFTVTVTASTTVEARTWDFTKWSAETIANLKADAANSKISGWSDVEKKADAEADADPTEASKDNCFWLTAETIDANGKAIAELAGLKFDADYCNTRSLAIAVNYPSPDASKDFGPYAGSSYLWLGGKNKTCFTIPDVKAGQKITMVIESHKISDGRGVTINDESFTPKAKDSHTWTIAADGDVVVKNTNGCHIYSIEVK